jgi:hypothetical protein
MRILEGLPEASGSPAVSNLLADEKEALVFTVTFTG